MKKFQIGTHGKLWGMNVYILDYYKEHDSYGYLLCNIASQGERIWATSDQMQTEFQPTTEIA